MSGPEQSTFVLPENLEELPTLEIEEIARQIIARARGILEKQGKLPKGLEDNIHRVRNAYNDILFEEEDDDEDVGNPAIFAGFKEVLCEVPKKEPVGRPFSKRKENRIKPGDTMNGGSTFFHSASNR